jgi:hypothetical protein
MPHTILRARLSQSGAGQVRRPSATSAALLAGSVAVSLNMLALWTSDRAGVPTAHGGLLQLLEWVLDLPKIGVAPAAGFHFFAGLGMALIYAHLLEPTFSGSAVLKGVGYAAVTWLLNAALVLPLIGEGFAGVGQIGAAGVVAFALCHTLFFVLMAVIYDRLRRRPLP